jgi:hypothetical protein
MRYKSLDFNSLSAQPLLITVQAGSLKAILFSLRGVGVLGKRQQAILKVSGLK